MTPDLFCPLIHGLVSSLASRQHRVWQWESRQYFKQSSDSKHEVSRVELEVDLLIENSKMIHKVHRKLSPQASPSQTILEIFQEGSVKDLKAELAIDFESWKDAILEDSMAQPRENFCLKKNSRGFVGWSKITK